MKKNLLLVTVFFTTTVLAQEQKPVYAFSLADAVSYAQKNNAQVKNSLLDIDIQIQTNKEIASAALPTIGSNLSATNFLTIPTSLLPGQIFGGAAGTFIPVQFGTKYNSTYGLNFNQILFDGQVFIALQARATSLDWKRKNAALTEENIKANIYKYTTSFLLVKHN